ncbi:hypothetical protein XA68_10488 [Ophiocordyceps unilateralis]|uniref:Grh/CP2 DB domain-containing protein n=1 Tax=Ophiocordyceps unilateralis TaxID=268505 RepID=A0A2A9P2K8_OPHUN|nr:hypothetical protein XA68_10488 [Ophiocordyceps unilateralis]
MFRSRYEQRQRLDVSSLTSSQKPGDDLLANFRQQFPEVVTVSTDTSASVIGQATTVNNPIIINQHAQKDCGTHNDHEPFRDHDPTPRATHEPWRFTPSLLDSGTYSFSSFANPGPGYYTPTPGGANTLFHSQAGDLHTGALSMVPGLGTPLSMPTSGDAMPSGTTMVDMTGFDGLHPQHFHHFNNPFMPAQAPHQQGLAPSTFVRRDTGFEPMDQDGSPMNSEACDDRMAPMAATLHSRDVTAAPMGHPLPASAEKFRFHSTLNAPTAMVRHADEIPVTYLNKGQAYSLSISDTSGTIPVQPGTRYRTFVRISFEDDEQRQKPGLCWSLWKEGRGTNEAHQRGGKLQAVEYVEAGQPAEGDDKRTRVELETSSFDGFSVAWTPGTHGVPEVNIAVRFNFLSTDFSHSKGVKGIPVRLCAKTRLMTSADRDDDVTPEICFCKVKLFRDHGAERKLSNDVAHVKKSTDKLKQQLAQMESGIKDFGKRKRHGGGPKGSAPQRPGKAPKHKRTWSMSSTSSAGGGGGGGGGHMTMEEDLHCKLQTLQDMFTSTRPVSVLYLRGEDSDDPDLHPVSLPGDMSPPAKTNGEAPRDGSNWQARSAQSSVTESMVSPSPSQLSLASQASAIGGSGGVARKSLDSRAAHGKASDRPSRVPKTDDQGALTGWIEALGVDPSYGPPVERREKPVACIFVLLQAGEDSEHHSLYRAIYLMKRTLEELNGRIARKWGLDAARIQRTTRLVQGGLEVEVDDDVVRELKEGQDMRLRVDEMTWQANTGLVLRLTF